MPKITSIQELNEKAWYRLLKIFYIGIFLLTLLGINASYQVAKNPYLGWQYGNNGVFDSETCNKEQKFIEMDKMLDNTIAKPILQAYLNDSSIDMTKRQKAMDALERGDEPWYLVGFIQQMYGNKYGVLANDISLNGITARKSSVLCDLNRTTYLKKYSEAQGKASADFFFAIVIDILIFIGIKKVFYYVVLGKLSPPKTPSN